MKKYVFIVRPWNVDFFLHLTKRIETSLVEVSIQYWTMQTQAVQSLEAKGKRAVFLPDAFEKAEYAEERVGRIDQELETQFGLSLHFLYEMERFKPAASQAPRFMGRQTAWLDSRIEEGTTLISLTCEHFVYMLAGFINRLKGGLNLYSIPTGFPQEANAICADPWGLVPIRKEALPEEYIEKYRASLQHDPLQSVHYMKTQKGPTVGQRIRSKLQRLKTPRTSELDSIFNYIRPTQITAAQKRRQKKGIPVALDYLNIDAIKACAARSLVFYFPLQLEPEMSILAYSPYYQNQSEVARLISQSLRHGDLLVVKENPKMHGKRDADFYLNLSKLPNLRWVDPKANSREIIRSVFKVVATTGTATMEAAAMGRPSMIFGHPPFRSLLAQPPVMDTPLSEFRENLYREPSESEIQTALEGGWPEYSRSLFFGNFVPRFVEGIRTTGDTDNLADRFFQEVVKPFINKP